MDTGLYENTGNELPVMPAPIRPASKVTAKEVVPWLFALVIMAAELFVTLFNVLTGMMIHVFLLVALLVMASAIWYRERRPAADIDETAGEVMIQGTPRFPVLHRPFSGADHPYPQPGHPDVEPPGDVLVPGNRRSSAVDLLCDHQGGWVPAGRCLSAPGGGYGSRQGWP